MTATINLSYAQLYSLAMQMPLQDRHRLSRELALDSTIPEGGAMQLDMEIIDARLSEAMTDIKDGRTYPVDDFFDEMENTYPWLCK